jgi:hypothetical protein
MIRGGNYPLPADVGPAQRGVFLLGWGGLGFDSDWPGPREVLLVARREAQPVFSDLPSPCRQLPTHWTRSGLL